MLGPMLLTMMKTLKAANIPGFDLNAIISQATSTNPKVGENDAQVKSYF